MVRKIRSSMFSKARLDTLRQFSAILPMVSSLLATALSFIHLWVALGALALNFAAPVIRKWSRPPAVLD